MNFYLGDAAVTALPVIAQLLLAAFLAVGGYRRYRLRERSAEAFATPWPLPLDAPGRRGFST